jgi:hypothetical protein
MTDSEMGTEVAWRVPRETYTDSLIGCGCSCMMPVVTARPICSLNRVKTLQDGVTAVRELLHQLGWPIPSLLARIDQSKRGTGCIVPLGAQTTPRAHDMRRLHEDGLSVLDAQTGFLADPAAGCTERES